MDTRSENDKRIDRRVYPSGTLVTREEFKRDTLTRMRRAFRLPLIESWVATCALRDDMSGAELHGVPGANPWAGEWLAEQSA